MPLRPQLPSHTQISESVTRLLYVPPINPRRPIQFRPRTKRLIKKQREYRADPVQRCTPRFTPTTCSLWKLVTAT